jgi:ADP-ribose pyrophosphatase YjhB (NUDIX family)
MCYDNPRPRIRARRKLVLAIVTDGDRFLCGRQLNYRKPLWKFFGGEFEPNELPREAARRELSQESGLELSAQEFDLISPPRTINYENPPRMFEQYIMGANVSPEVLDPYWERIMRRQDPTSPDEFEVTCFDRQTLYQITRHSGEFLENQRSIARWLSFARKTSRAAP